MRSTLKGSGSAAAHRGVTLVELMVSLIISSVIVVLMGKLLFDADFALGLGQEQVNLQRDMSYAMNRVGMMMRGASEATVNDDGDEVAVERRVGSTIEWTRTFVCESGALLLREDGLDDEVVIGDGVTALGFANPVIGGSENENAVEVSLTLSSDSEKLSAVTVFALRNLEGS